MPEESSSPSRCADDETSRCNVPSFDPMQISFQDFTDVQTRLLMLPRIEEEALGAVVASFDTRPDLQGYSLAGVQVATDSIKNIFNEDFATILSNIREAPCPIVLQFKNEDNSEQVNEEGDSDKERPSAIDQSTPEVRHPKAEIVEEKKAEAEDELADSAQKSESSPKQGWGDFSAWTTRVRETSKQLAAEAASSAAQISTAVAVAAEKQRTKALAARKAAQDTNSSSFLLFMHDNSGSFQPVDQSGKNNVLTNSSLLVVRISADEPCPTAGHSFQWYRSLSGGTEEWTPLEGATHAAFQPSATEIGFRLRCVVTIETGAHTDSLDESSCTSSSEDEDSIIVSNDDSDSEGSASERQLARKVVCETEAVVRATPQLFNGSRQALVRGAQFAGLVGRGRAEGRSFRLKVDMAMSQNPVTKNGEAISAVTVYQVSGTTAEPIHPESEPLVGVFAKSSYVNPKDFELIFPSGIPESASMIAALSDEGSFLLQAPNRLGRESVLLAIGIANFTGKPSALKESTVLFGKPTVMAGATNDVEHSTGDSSDNSDVPMESPMIRLPRTPSLVTSNRSASSKPPTPYYSPIAFQRSASLDSRNMESSPTEASRIGALEEEMKATRGKLAAKDKIVSQLQRQITEADATRNRYEQMALILEGKVESIESEKRSVETTLHQAEKRIADHDSLVEEIRSEHSKKVTLLEKCKQEQWDQIGELEKTARILQNEKAVLSAAVEAREIKLARTAELQKSLEQANEEVAKQDGVRKQLSETSDRCRDLSLRIEQSETSEKETKTKLTEAQSRIVELEKRLQLETAKNATHQSELDSHQMKVQRLKAERNNYKQKSDSLAKEIGRVCRNGRTVREVEKILADDTARRQEVELLRQQKQTALEELEHYRTAYEQSKMVQKLAGIDHDSSCLLERNAELERLLSELTEYVTAKEMQLETMKQVNDALQTEIHDLAQANMSKNDV